MVKMKRSITQAELETYRRDGFVHLRGVLDESWLKVLKAAVSRVGNEGETQPRVMNMSAMRRQLDAKKDADKEPGEKAIETPGETAGDYIIAHNAWRAKTFFSIP